MNRNKLQQYLVSAVVGLAGISSFVEFGGDVEAPEVAAVTELLRGVTAAAERWVLPPQ